MERARMYVRGVGTATFARPPRDLARDGRRRSGHGAVRRCHRRHAVQVQGAGILRSPVNVIPIANTLPLDVGIKQGFFEKQGLDIKKVVLQSGNDIVSRLPTTRARSASPAGCRR